MPLPSLQSRVSLLTVSSIFGVLVGLGGCASVPENPPAVVPEVDIERYAGLWYDVGRFPAPFQGDCVCSTADYRAVSPTEIAVTNSCRQKAPSGDVREVNGTARVIDPAHPAKLAVRFFLFDSPYWIVSLDDDYQWAVVSNPERENLWILSRAPSLDEELRGRIIADLRERGFDMSRLLPSGQLPGCWPNQD